MSESESPNPTPTRGVPINLGNEERVRYLRYPLSTLRKMEKEQMALGNLIHLGLTNDDPDLTVEMVEDLIDLEHLHELRDALKQATAGLVDLAKIYASMFDDLENAGAGEVAIVTEDPTEESSPTQSSVA